MRDLIIGAVLAILAIALINLALDFKNYKEERIDNKIITVCERELK